MRAKTNGTGDSSQHQRYSAAWRAVYVSVVPRYRQRRDTPEKRHGDERQAAPWYRATRTLLIARKQRHPPRCYSVNGGAAVGMLRARNT